MSKPDSSSRLTACASALAVVAGAVAATPAYAHGFESAETDSYMAGDFHNHTTCTDGSVSIETLVKASVKTYGLEWMAQAGHGGTGTRDCRYDDPNTKFGANDPSGSSVNGDEVFWDSTLPDARYPDIQHPPVAILGDPAANSAGHRPMWKWQIMRDFAYPEVARLSKQLFNPMLYVGLETNVPGHEHVSTTVLGNQQAWKWNWASKPFGNANSIAEFEFRFDRSDNDFSGPNGTPGSAPGVKGTPGDWVGKVATASGAGSGTANHVNKAVPSVAWMQANFPLDSYYVPAHVERAGVFDPNASRGFNVEHFRDFNNAGPTVAVGFETMPGHQASSSPGEYRKDFGGPGIDSVGVTTYGRTGIYGAKIGGLWDAMLGEGRNWFFYASSDWHNRGTYSPFVRESTQDFYPGEYQKLYIPRPDSHSFWHRLHSMRPQYIVDSVRNGDSYSVTGDLIGKDLSFTAEIEGDNGFHHFGWWDHVWKNEAKMGETLIVPRGKKVRITLTVTDPLKTNNSPYSFDNPSLKQVGLSVPLNRPKLDHVDFIGGKVTGIIPPGSPNYTNATNPSAGILRTFNATSWKRIGEKRTMSFVIKADESQYVRVRGTNLPLATPNETDAQGNPLSDEPTSKIPCTDAACPAHMQTDAQGNKLSSFDVAAWSDLWFYTNPIFIRVKGDPKLRVEVAHECAEDLADRKNVNCATKVASGQ